MKAGRGQRLGVTMRVDRHVDRLPVGSGLGNGRSILPGAGHERFKQNRPWANFFCSVQAEFAIVFREHRVARRLEKNNRERLLCFQEKTEIVPSGLRGPVEVPLAEGGSATAFPVFDQANAVTERLQDLDCGVPICGSW